MKIDLYKYFKGNVTNRIQYMNSSNPTINLYHYFKESPDRRPLFLNSLINEHISSTPYPQQPPTTISLNGKPCKKSP